MNQNAIIFGDSYSTFHNYVPEGYAVYYFEGPQDGVNVTDVSLTWWHMVADEANLNLVLNNSWSGSTIGYTGYDNVDCSQSSSFIYRLKQLIADDFFINNNIQKVFVFGGTNDSWSDAPLGEPKYENWENDDFYCVLPAIGFFFKLLKETLPQAEIYCLINTEIKEEITSCMEEACEKYGITPVHFEHIEKEYGHPTVPGMITIKNAVLEALKAPL